MRVYFVCLFVIVYGIVLNYFCTTTKTTTTSIHTHTNSHKYIHTYTRTHTHTHTYIHRDVSVAKWMVWLACNCGRIGVIGSIPSNGLEPNL